MFKRLALMGLMLFVLTSSAWADVTAEILAYDLDDNGNIRVKTQYKIDGVEVVSNYPMLGGKHYFVTRYTVQDFAGMSDAEIKARVLEDVNKHAENLVRRTFVKKANQDIKDNHLVTIVGTTATKKEAKINVDTDGDGIVDTEWSVKTDGSFNATPISTP